jgi:tryptophan halogenase
MRPSIDVTAAKAARLFKIVEDLGVACGYERSFKMLERTLLANRFLLGISTADLSPERLLDVCGELDMPAPYRESFRAHLADANLVFLGFEDNERSSLYKVYLEFWDKVTSDVRRKANKHEPVLLHLGFKWNTDDNTQKAVSHYLCHPLLPVEGILQRLSDLYQAHPDNASHRIAEDLIAFAARRTAGTPFIYVEVGEDDGPRRSFDINLYKANLRLREITPWLRRMREHYAIPPEAFDRLYPLVEDKRFGHLAGGLGRDGKDFLTVYYEV